MLYSHSSLSKPAWLSDFWEHKKDVLKNVWEKTKVVCTSLPSANKNFDCNKLHLWFVKNNSSNVLRKQMSLDFVLTVMWSIVNVKSRFNLAQNQLLKAVTIPDTRALTDSHMRSESAMRSFSNIHVLTFPSACMEMRGEITEPSGSDVSVSLPQGRPHASACKSRQLQHKTQVTQEQLAHITLKVRERTHSIAHQPSQHTPSNASACARSTENHHL